VLPATAALMIVGRTKFDERVTTMAEGWSLTVREAVEGVLASEHADVLRESVAVMVREIMELYRARHRLLKARERLNARERCRLSELFEHDPVVAEAWGLKEAFATSTSLQTAPRPSGGSTRSSPPSTGAGLPAFDAFAKGIRQWRTELLAYFDEPTTNGYAEGVTNKIKVIKRRAYGLPTFDGFRARVLLACG
jgi:transposase